MSTIEDESVNYKSILYTNAPDKHLEYFWYNFKKFIHNHTQNFGIQSSLITENLSSFSNELNILQNQKNYAEIEIYIYQYLLYSPYQIINLYKQLLDPQLNISISMVTSYFTLLIKFYKRWNEICNSCNKIPIIYDTTTFLTRIDLPNSKYLLNTIILFQIGYHLNYDMIPKYLELVNCYFHLDTHNYWYKNYQIKTENIDNLIFMMDNFWKKTIPYFLIYNIEKQWFSGLNFINLIIKIIPYWIQQIEINNPKKLSLIHTQISNNHHKEMSIKKLLIKYHKLIEISDFNLT